MAEQSAYGGGLAALDSDTFTNPTVPTGTATYPGISLEVAFNGGPYVTPNWTRISNVETVTFTRGRSSELDEFQTGTLNAVVDNSTRRFDVDYTAGTYYGLLRPNRQVRLRANFGATDYDLWYGVVPTWGPTDYNTAFADARFTVNAVDHFSLLADLPLEAKYPFTIGHAVLGKIDDLAVFAGDPEWLTERSGTRVGQILDLLGWPDDRRDIDEGLTQLIADVPGAVTTLAYLQRIARAEHGHLFMATDGALRFRQRRWQTAETTASTSQATYTDATTGTHRYQRLSLDPSSPTYIRNVIRRSNGKSTVEARDLSSMDEHGSQLDEQTDSLILRVQEMQDQANDVLARYKDAVARFTALDVVGHENPSTTFPQILGRDIGDRITVVRTPKPGATAVTRECHIEGISQTIDATTGSWSCTWSLSAVDTREFFTIEDPVYGVIDSIAVFAY